MYFAYVYLLSDFSILIYFIVKAGGESMFGVYIYFCHFWVCFYYFILIFSILHVLG